MSAWRTNLSQFLRRRSGATAIEYTLIAAVLGVGIFAAFETFLGDALTVILGEISQGVTGEGES